MQNSWPFASARAPFTCRSVLGVGQFVGKQTRPFTAGVSVSWHDPWRVILQLLSKPQTF